MRTLIPSDLMGLPPGGDVGGDSVIVSTCPAAPRVAPVNVIVAGGGRVCLSRESTKRLEDALRQARKAAKGR